MKPRTVLFAALFGLAGVIVRGEESRTSTSQPQPRLRLDPNSGQVISQPVKVETAMASASPPAASAGPVLMSRYVVRGRAVPQEAPKQEMVQGDFTWLKGGKIIGNDRYEIGVWPMMEYTKVGQNTALRDGGPRLNVDFLHIRF